MRKLFGTLVVGGMLMAPAFSFGAGQPQDAHDNAQRYYDTTHKDYHNWNDREDKAYRVWVADQHRNYATFNTLPPRDQASYWAWRHNHSDAVLKIDVR